MKKILTFFFFAITLSLTAQTVDTTIYTIVEQMPRFPGCEQLDTTDVVKNKCAETNLLLFFNSNIAYPVEARQTNVQGTVVLSLVVEPDGFISNPTIVRDIGAGCGAEALRVAEGMNQALREASAKWTPGVKGGKAVRTKITVPIKFRLEDPKPYVFADGRDTMYVEVVDSVSYKDGEEALQSFLQSKMKMPGAYQDSCKIGVIDMSLYVHPTGYVRVIDLTDYWNLGTDFQWEAIKAATATWGNWNSATYEGKKVPSSTSVQVEVMPQEAGCQQVISNYAKANSLAEEGSRLYNEGESEAGIAKLTEAIELFPNNANFLYLRGQAYMNLEKMDEACADFQKVRTIFTIGLVEQLVPLICN